MFYSPGFFNFRTKKRLVLFESNLNSLPSTLDSKLQTLNPQSTTVTFSFQP
jgi:hypothetical protein